MAIEYRLTLAGSVPVEKVAARAFPEPRERPAGVPPLLSADLYERYGFDVTVRAGTNGYVDAEGDDGQWEWEVPAYVAMTFRMEKTGDTDRADEAMTAAVRRVLESGAEDAALVLNGDWLLLLRAGGVVTRRRAAWWATHTAAVPLG